jgi:soluble cytochrome b562
MPIDDYVGLPFFAAQNARLEEARKYIGQGEFYNAKSALQKIVECADAIDTSRPDGFREVTLELYKLGIGVRMREAQQALQEGKLEDAQEKLGLVAHYAKGLKIQVPPEAAALKRKLFNASVQAALKKQGK